MDDQQNVTDTLIVTVEDTADAFDRAVEDAGNAEEGEQTSAKVSFTNAGGLRRVLTDECLDILRELLTAPADSIDTLATRLDSDRTAIEEDVATLVGCGIVTRSDGQLFVPYDAIRFRVVLKS